ncbi:VOC family protein [Variovorax soli]|uniref:VOC family protein n=1 Tax=Variovorax soli TaxID=376815 RepID=UPI00083914A6|nr:VOC family protein [Variovorax soli]
MSLTLLLRCRDLEETREFYHAVLGFHTMESAQSTLTVEKEGGKLIFTTQDLWATGPGFSGTIYFSVADVEGFWNAVKDKTPVAWPIQDMPYGAREFGLRDCNGYLLAFRQAE